MNQWLDRMENPVAPRMRCVSRNVQDGSKMTGAGVAPRMRCVSRNKYMGKYYTVIRSRTSHEVCE